ncbi:hypothetical protein DPV78_000332 [Talaromyces pinophilus]|nr:hypothetical protein DPV78_000332 [Talaromyces pinophilus]
MVGCAIRRAVSQIGYRAGISLVPEASGISKLRPACLDGLARSILVWKKQAAFQQRPSLG